MRAYYAPSTSHALSWKVGDFPMRKTGTERLSNWPKVTLPVHQYTSSQDRILGQASLVPKAVPTLIYPIQRLHGQKLDLVRACGI